MQLRKFNWRANDDEEDLDGTRWAGVLPIESRFMEPIPNKDLKKEFKFRRTFPTKLGPRFELSPQFSLVGWVGEVPLPITDNR